MNSNLKGYDGVQSVPAGACYNFWKCGNTVPGGNKTGNEMCDECLAWARSGGRGHEAEENADRSEERIKV